MIKKIKAESIKDSRGEKTICVILETSKGKFKTSAPSGKSKGKYEAKPYAKSFESDIKFIDKLDVEKLNNIFNKYSDKKIKNWKEAVFILRDIEKLVGNKIGANSLFSLEACILKGLAQENGKELWEFLIISSKKNIAFLRPVGNAVGGSIHSKDINGKKPDFQEFLFIANGKSFAECVRINKKAYKLTEKFLKARQRNDEGTWETYLDNEGVLIIMKKVQEKLKEKKLEVDIGIDVASSEFYSGSYNYKNFPEKRNKQEQINFINHLIKRYNLLYVEDGLNENDFSGFRQLKNKCRNCLIIGDDLTVTNPIRLKKAIRMGAINGIIVKPNQIGSLLKVKEVIDIAKKNNIRTIISHRSGETKDDTIADLAVGWSCDFIKTGIYGSVRTAKLKRITRIEKEI